MWTYVDVPEFIIYCKMNAVQGEDDLPSGAAEENWFRGLPGGPNEPRVSLLFLQAETLANDLGGAVRLRTPRTNYPPDFDTLIPLGGTL